MKIDTTAFLGKNIATITQRDYGAYGNGETEGDEHQMLQFRFTDGTGIDLRTQDASDYHSHFVIVRTITP